MRNFIQPGNSLAIAVPYATGVSAGQGVLVGALFGVAAVDGVQNAMIEAATMGVFDLTKEPALAIAAGVRVFWDNTNRRITATAAGNFQVGIATQAALATDWAARVMVHAALARLAPWAAWIRWRMVLRLNLKVSSAEA
jgi:predicted RecA/RadA family phage recombinase